MATHNTRRNKFSHPRKCNQIANVAHSDCLLALMLRTHALSPSRSPPRSGSPLHAQRLLPTHVPQLMDLSPPSLLPPVSPNPFRASRDLHTCTWQPHSYTRSAPNTGTQTAPQLTQVCCHERVPRAQTAVETPRGRPQFVPTPSQAYFAQATAPTRHEQPRGFCTCSWVTITYTQMRSKGCVRSRGFYTTGCHHLISLCMFVHLSAPFYMYICVYGCHTILGLTPHTQAP